MLCPELGPLIINRWWLGLVGGPFVYTFSWGATPWSTSFAGRRSTDIARPLSGGILCLPWGQAQTRSNALWAYRLCAHVSAPSNLSRSGRLYFFFLVGFEFGSKSGTVSGSCTEQQKNRRHRSISQQDPVRHLGYCCVHTQHAQRDCLCSKSFKHGGVHPHSFQMVRQGSRAAMARESREGKTGPVGVVAAWPQESQC